MATVGQGQGQGEGPRDALIDVPVDDNPPVCGGPPDDEDWKYWLGCIFCACGGCAFGAWVMHWIANAAGETGNRGLSKRIHQRARKFLIWGVVFGLIFWVIQIVFAIARS